MLDGGAPGRGAGARARAGGAAPRREAGQRAGQPLRPAAAGGLQRRRQPRRPAGRLLARAALARPFLMAALLVALPHVLGSVVNITYNSLRIKLTPSQAEAFFWLLPAYNAVVYPLCLGLFFRQWLLVYRVWQ